MDLEALKQQPRRSMSPRGGSRSWSRSLSRSRTSSPSRSRSPSRDSRWYRNRSFSRTPSPSSGLPRSSKIIVEKLTKNVTTSHLREIFGSFGDIKSLELPMNRAFMTNRGAAYILYHDPADAEAAISHMHEAQLDGAVLNVSIVLPRRAFSRSPPPAENGRGGSVRRSKEKSAHPRGQP
ncbi:RNA-binding domain-containing protein [Aspergillus udagawae]|uniref:RNA-binding domain-containing protein n=1 Tax=Aspergillus udagawae TaxID=91492 RepID=A0ABQ1BC85_9EURO|nr:RNA-binding domain-containing protein [Aspergillus udagawae]